MPEIEYDADGDPGDSVGGVKGAGKVDDKPNEWRKNLENFHLPTVSDDEFLDGCKVHTYPVNYQLNLKNLCCCIQSEI